jgi:hypothetical protein
MGNHEQDDHASFLIIESPPIKQVLRVESAQDSLHAMEMFLLHNVDKETRESMHPIEGLRPHAEYMHTGLPESWLTQLLPLFVDKRAKRVAKELLRRCFACVDVPQATETEKIALLEHKENMAPFTLLYTEEEAVVYWYFFFISKNIFFYF